MMNTSSIMIHGGIRGIGDSARYEDSLRRIVEAGAALLAMGTSALDAVLHCVALLEDDPLYNAGRGSVLNAEGFVECDAGVMDGRTLDAGAVAGVRGVKNPIVLARAVMEKSGHVFLIGSGAERFAREQGVEFAGAEYFVTEARTAQWKEAKKREQSGRGAMGGKLGTVGAVARDRHGDLAAATSTGGRVNKLWGRVGDSPVIGAGVFADNASCAISCTGVGEHFLRTSLARTAAMFVELQDMNATQAADAAIMYLVRKVHGEGGLIVVDRSGACARAHSTPGMLTATAANGKIAVQTA